MIDSGERSNGHFSVVEAVSCTVNTQYSRDYWLGKDIKQNGAI